MRDNESETSATPLTPDTKRSPRASNPRQLLADIDHRLLALEEATDLLCETNYCARATAQDALEFGVLDAIARLRRAHDDSHPPDLTLGAGDLQTMEELAERAATFGRRLESIDRGLLKDLRDQIRGGLRGAPLRAILDGQAIGRHHVGHSPGYDALDGFIADLILSIPAPTASLDREPEMVFYQPTPVRIILDLVDRGGFTRDDLFVDIGSGLGMLPIVVNLLTGTRARGIEIDPSYHRYATSRATELALADVDFVNADAREADYRVGTAFFLYTPFTGQMLQAVLDRINLQREGRPVMLFSFGPCTEMVASQAWLRPAGKINDEHTLAMFRAV